VCEIPVAPRTRLSQTGSINLIVGLREHIVATKRERESANKPESGNFFFFSPFGRQEELTSLLIATCLPNKENLSFMARMESFSLEEVVTPTVVGKVFELTVDDCQGESSEAGG